MSFTDEVLSGHLRGADQIATAGPPSSTCRAATDASCSSPPIRATGGRNHGEFGMLFNTLLHYNDLDSRPD